MTHGFFSVPAHNTGGLTETFHCLVHASKHKSDISCFDTLRADESTKCSCVRDKGLLHLQRTQRASSTFHNSDTRCQDQLDHIICKLLCHPHTDPKWIEVYRYCPRYLDQVTFAPPTRSGLGLFCNDHTLLREILRPTKIDHYTAWTYLLPSHPRNEQ